MSANGRRGKGARPKPASPANAPIVVRCEPVLPPTEQRAPGPLDKWPRLSVSAAVGQVAQGAASVLALFALAFQMGQTNESLQLAKDSVRLERRPWVGAVSVDRWTAEIGRPLAAAVVVRNYGPTPALRYEGRITLRPTQPTTAEIESATVAEQTSSPLFPDSEKELQAIGSTVVPQELIEAIRQGRAKVFAAGLLKYEDAFGDPHRTFFCFEIGQDLKQWRACRTGNIAD